jgi:mono/diheme cytochrome c family protein
MKKVKRWVSLGYPPYVSRQGRMPAHGEFLGEAKIHLLATYVYSLWGETL